MARTIKCASGHAYRNLARRQDSFLRNSAMATHQDQLEWPTRPTNGCNAIAVSASRTKKVCTKVVNGGMVFRMMQFARASLADPHVHLPSEC